jgi:hypothetical protein
MVIRPNTLKIFSKLLILFLHLKKNIINSLQSAGQYTGQEAKGVT